MLTGRLLALAAAAAFLRSELTPLLDFRYAWPAEAASIPALDAALRRQQAVAHADAVATARESRSSAREAGVAFHREEYHEAWTVAGRTSRYLSLTADIATDNNGAHPNSDHAALLWSRARGRAVTVAAVLGAARLAAMAPRYCERLDALRIAASGEPPAMPCPPIGARVLAFADRDRDGRLDALRVLIPPYIAASHADGSFIVDVPLAPGDLAGLAAVDRPSFESARR